MEGRNTITCNDKNKNINMIPKSLFKHLDLVIYDFLEFYKIPLG